MEIGSEHEVRFTDLLANGQGVGRVDSQVVFAWGPLPDERARIRIVEKKKSYAVGEMLELIAPSPERTIPFCPVFGTCGGCQVQHLSYPAQLAWKSRLVRDALERIGGFAGVNVAPAIGMDEPRAYRNKMALVVERAKGHVAFGFYQMRSLAFVPIDACPVVLPQLDSEIAALREAADDPKLGNAFAQIKHVIARAGASTGESVTALTSNEPSPQIASAAPELAKRLPGTKGISNSFLLSSANAILGRKQRVLWGEAEMEERIALPDGSQVRYRVSAASFFQVNSAMVGRLFEKLAQLPQPRSVVDLYCGAGTFAIWFARRGATVIGIEENPAAIREAQANAKLNGVADKAHFLCGRVETLVGKAEGRNALRSEVAFLDPPRKGSDVQTLDALAAARVPAIWYLSCNPATLARDLAHLRAAGYLLEETTPFDFFPQTGHIETLARVRRQDAP
ncbi:MAG TPA: 23S rRNA (uracil(1939)-C(5))-methyltransferase RlmD [Candidatus Acidoferrales bacterium]|nr:23S rRNA (uracil(1939)-C(5))-methyltransferase RlmD [Candidatus Acidoferrales bacterium]